jgi:hypothetical protein
MRIPVASLWARLMHSSLIFLPGGVNHETLEMCRYMFTDLQ